MNLRSVLKDRFEGLDADNLTDEQVRKIAKTLGLEVPRSVEIVDRKRGRAKEYHKCVQTDPFIVTNTDGSKSKVAGLSVRVDVLDQAIEDLIRAKSMLSDDDSE